MNPQELKVGELEARTQEQRDRLRMFWVLFQLLRISPSYERARLLRAGRQSPNLDNNDDLLLLSNHALFGDVRKTFFMPWWRGTASVLFREGSSDPALAELQSSDPTKWLDTITRYMLAVRQRGQDTKSANWQLALRRMTPSQRELWPVSSEAGRYSRRGKDEYELDRKSLSNGFTADLRQGMLLAENAARGLFLSYAPRPAVKYDYAKIGRRLKAIEKWEGGVLSRGGT